MDKQEPTVEQLDALKKFAAIYGRNWKQELRDAWMSGDGRDIGELRQLRNTLGPSWLNRFQFPKEA
jgi:hypothetical protein